MYEVQLQDFRCFHEEQTVRLAPLTILVGENSTGKTSFLALLRALWTIGYRQMVPDFTETPYDLGSFADIAHNRGASRPACTSFRAGYKSQIDDSRYKYDALFVERGTVPFPKSRSILAESESIVERRDSSFLVDTIQCKTDRGQWNLNVPDKERNTFIIGNRLGALCLYPRMLRFALYDPTASFALPVCNSPEMIQEDLEHLDTLAHFEFQYNTFEHPLYATAPVRSQPRRKNHPARTIPDPQGDHAAMMLAEMSLKDPQTWEAFKAALQGFGEKSGLFDEISVRRLGSTSLHFSLTPVAKV